MIPRCPVCNSLAGTSRTAAGKRMWCTARGCMWSAGRGGGRVDRTGYVRGGTLINNEGAATPGLHLESDKIT